MATKSARPGDGWSSTLNKAFDLVAVIDFSAAASIGPVRPTKDRCWLATARGEDVSEPLYFRTRLALMDHLVDLLRAVDGTALLAWDFPFGYPVGSGLGGGKTIATRLLEAVQDGQDGRNNRFQVASDFNDGFGVGPGPFWGRPSSLQGTEIPEKRPDFSPFRFNEWRIVERHARAGGHHHLQSVWKLYTTGSVGSQALMGLALIARLNAALGPGRRTAFWPFDTQWDRALQGIVHAECWPSLFRFDHINHPIRDARQVAATRDLLAEANRDGCLHDLLACPETLAGNERAAVETEEGWILGFSPD